MVVCTPGWAGSKGRSQRQQTVPAATAAAIASCWSSAHRHSQKGWTSPAAWPVQPQDGQGGVSSPGRGAIRSARSQSVSLRYCPGTSSTGVSRARATVRRRALDEAAYSAGVMAWCIPSSITRTLSGIADRMAAARRRRGCRHQLPKRLWAQRGQRSSMTQVQGSVAVMAPAPRRTPAALGSKSSLTTPTPWHRRQNCGHAWA